MRIELTNVDGFKWHRIGTNLYFANVVLGEWDSSENYEQVADSDVPSEEDDLSAEDMLNQLNTIVNG